MRMEYGIKPHDRQSGKGPQYEQSKKTEPNPNRWRLLYLSPMSVDCSDQEGVLEIKKEKAFEGGDHNVGRDT